MSQAGKDFSGQNLRGRNFKGQDLTGANFSYADIRGANFSNAILRETNFTGAKAGLRSYQLLFLLGLTFLAVVAIAFTFGVGSLWVIKSLSSKELKLLIIAGSIFSAILGILGIPFSVAAYVEAKETATRSAIASIICTTLLIVGVLSFGFTLDYSLKESYFLASVLFFLGLLCLIFTCLVSMLPHLANSLVAIFSPVIFIAVTAGRFLPDTFTLSEKGITVHSILLGANISAFLFTVLSAIALYSHSNHVIWLRLFFTDICCFLGTSFRCADLTNADFNQAVLSHSDLSKATLFRTYFYAAKGLAFAKARGTYLNFSTIKKLVSTNYGKNRDFSGLSLEKINLQNSNLQDASFTKANLSNANLQVADLSRAVLKQTQLDGADLTGALLTGAYIEDWGITGNTKLEGIRCEYVYMHVPTKEDPDPIRKPDNRNEVFEDGDFADFIRPLTDTLDLYHNQGVDPRAIAIAFKDLAEKYPDAELEIVAMEKKGKDKFLLRARTATTADKSELSTEYFSTYNQIKGLSEGQVRALLVEKDSRIQSLEAMVVTALQRPSFYSHIERTDSVSNNPGGISQNVSGGNVYGGMQAAQGSNNTQSQEIHSIASGEQGITQDQVIALFAQLESVLHQPELPGEVRAKAAKYLDAAKEEITAKEPDKKLAAGNLKRMAETIETTSKTMESSKKIWETTKPILEAVLPWLGVAKGFFGF